MTKGLVWRWWSQQDSNLYLKFRKLSFYPLNYGAFATKIRESTYYWKNMYLCAPFSPGGGTGRRAGLKIRW